MTTHYKFWMVWNPAGRVPAKRYSSYESAKKDARILAEKQPKDSFYVLENMGGYSSEVPKPEWYEANLQSGE